MSEYHKNERIPRIIHQIWIQGEKHMPEEIKKYTETCKQMNPEFSYNMWDLEKIEQLIKVRHGVKMLTLFKSLDKFAQKADMARYCIIYAYGGIYIDADTICKKSLLPLLNVDMFLSKDYWFYFQLIPKYLNGIFGAIPNHPIFPMLLKEIHNRVITQKKGDNVTYSTGTKLFYDVIQKYFKSGSNSHNIYLLDPKFLHPCHVLSSDSCKNKCKDCYTVHTNYGSWSPSLRLLKQSRSYLNIVLIIMTLIILLKYKTKVYNIIKKWVIA
jgi:inositol phosphorylceramide mannosyltransferase catalytic subunit